MTEQTHQQEQTKRTFTITLNEPSPHWLNADNLAWLLEKHAPGGTPYTVIEQKDGDK